MTRGPVRPGVLLRALVLCLVLGLPATALAGLADRLETEHGTGQIRDGNRRWTTQELKILDASLSTLDRKEKRALRGVDIVRMRTSPRPRGAGLYKVDRRGARILVYNRAFRGEGRGSARAPNRTLVHEVGHAVSHFRVRRLLEQANRAVGRTNAAVDAYNAEVRRHNRLARTANRSGKEGDRRALAAAKAKLKDLAGRLRAEQKEASVARRRLRSAQRDFGGLLPRQGPMAGYRKALHGRLGPTAYGRTSIRESFAESYSLYYCAPEELRRKLPKVAAWIDAGGHREGM